MPGEAFSPWCSPAIRTTPIEMRNDRFDQELVLWPKFEDALERRGRSRCG
jgi:hypothetical protein